MSEYDIFAKKNEVKTKEIKNSKVGMSEFKLPLITCENRLPQLEKH